jgi:hypothetical protein
MSTEKLSFKDFAKTASKTMVEIWNPTGQCLAAEFWVSKKKNKPDGSPESGFSPVCCHKFDRGAGCELGRGGKCRDCDKKEILPISEEMVFSHIIGDRPGDRRGIYPMLPGNVTAWVAGDLDNHDGKRDPSGDLRKLIEVCRALEVPIMIFSSNSGSGYHVYLFFKSPIPAFKARALLLALLDRAGVDISHRKDKEGSFDCVFPKQDRLS